jgi:uncharacterized LabA/DUF88 family protein
VDGFNLYYGSLKGTPHKWLDLCDLFQRILPEDCTLVKVKYFTARIKPQQPNDTSPQRQDVYLRALREFSHGQVDIVEGRYQLKPKKAPLKSNMKTIVEVMISEEKGSDVNLAVEMLNDAWKNEFDCAAVVSNDSDLSRALQLVKQAQRKRVYLFTPGFPRRQPTAELSRWANRKFGIDVTELAASQLPDQIPGTNISKPKAW